MSRLRLAISEVYDIMTDINMVVPEHGGVRQGIATTTK